MNKYCKLISQLFIFMAICGSAVAQKSDRSITVTGEAQVQVAPDEATITLGIETTHSELYVAKTDNDSRITTIIASIKDIGITSKHIRTEHINIAPEYKYGKFSNQAKQYNVKRTLVITLRELDKFEQVLTTALEAGANYVHGVEFRTTELRKHRDQARILAITAAKEKAQALSKELDETIGKAVNIQEGHVGWRSSYGSWWGHSGRGSMSQNVVQNSTNTSDNQNSPTIPGQIGINTSITITFELQ